MSYDWDNKEFGTNKLLVEESHYMLPWDDDI